MSASGPSKVVVLDPDARASRQVQLGFEREGMEVVVPAIPADLAKLQLGLANGELPALALVGGSEGAAIDLVKRVRALLVARNADVPIVFTGRGSRAELVAAGADAVLVHPIYLRDVVTISRILRGVARDRREHLVGSLADTTGVYTLVRALCALGRSAVLTLLRGLRRGEIRFYRGEVTSAQVGLIHGQAAFHQLLLWTDARFDFSYEEIVRRAQIPMTSEELFKDAERFLEGVRESAELLSPSMVLEQDHQRVQGLGKQIPTEVYGVLRMFDGHRVLADILEDSPYRVFETLRVAQKAMEVGLLRPVAEQRPKTSWRAVLAIEEWLVGSETRETVAERTSVLESGSVTRLNKPKFKKGKRSKKARTPPIGTSVVKPASEAKPDEIDWAALLPRSIGAEVGQLSGVVPAAAQHGEIDLASRDTAREKLEALMDTGKRDRIFPTEIGIEPSVVVRDDGEEAAERSAPASTPADGTVKQAFADADTDRPGAAADDAKARVHEAAEKLSIEREREVEQRELEQTTRKSAADQAKVYAARVKAAAEAKRSEAERDLAAASMIATPIRDADRGSTRVIVADAITVAETSTATVTVAETMTVVGVADTATITTMPRVVVRERLRADSVKPTNRELTQRELDLEGGASAAPHATEDEPSDGTPNPMFARIETAPLLRRSLGSRPAHDGPPVKQTTGEISKSFKPQAEVTQGPSILIEHEPAPATPSAPPLLDGKFDRAGDPSGDPSGDELATTAFVRADPEPDAPVAAVAKPTAAPVAAKSVPRPDAEQNALVADLAAAHAAIAAATARASAAPSKGDASSSSKEMVVSQVRKDAVEFTSDEEAFFNERESHTAAAPKFESFDDLDEGYEPPKFWDRVFGKKTKPH
jgi:hypothetical protein